MWDDTGVLSLGSLDKIKDIQAQWVSAHCSIRLRTGVEPDVVFSCCSPSASRLEMFCEMLFCSSRVCRVVIWVTLAFLSAQTGLAVPLWPQDISVCRTECVFFRFSHHSMRVSSDPNDRGITEVTVIDKIVPPFWCLTWTSAEISWPVPHERRRSADWVMIAWMSLRLKTPLSFRGSLVDKNCERLRHCGVKEDTS